MNKRIRCILLGCIVLLACVLLLTACDKDDDPQKESMTTEAGTQAHVHAFSDWMTVLETTCVENGKQQRVCACGEIESRTNMATGHEEGEWSVSSEPTCTQNGTEYRACKKCHIVLKINSIPAVGHTEGEWVVKREPSCTRNGSKALLCSVCEESIKTETLKKTGHTEAVVDAVAPTCTEAGLTEGKNCSVCNEVLLAQEEVSAKGHTEGEAVVENNVAPTCLGEGSYDHVVYCSACETELDRQSVTVSATGHTEGDAVVENNAAPTCTEAGSYDQVVYCTSCSTELGREHMQVSATGHSEVTDAAVAPTCTESGLTEGVHCLACGEVFTAQNEIAALGHALGEVVVENSVSPTCTETGAYDNAVYCTVCNAEVSRDTVTVDALGHTEIIDAAVAPTCTESGLTEGRRCDVCEEILIAQEIAPAKGHTEVTDAAVAPTCTESGLTEGSHCEVCDIVLLAQYEVAALGHTEGKAVKENNTLSTCLEGGSYDRVVYCVTCGIELSRENVSVSAAGHTEEIDEAVAPTCTETGLTEGMHCSVCDMVLLAQQTVAALGHTEVIDPAVAPGCNENGLTEGAHCAVCDEVLVAQQIVAATHTWSGYGDDDDTHWPVCGVCSEKGQAEAHSFAEDGFCSVCERSIRETDGLHYQISADGTYAEVIDYTGKSTVVYIAEEFEGLPVKVIGNAAFQNKHITEIYIPETVEVIGELAFGGCTGLVSIVIPNSVKSIGSGALSGCSGLESITIPFVGQSAKTEADPFQYPLGYIFGTAEYEGGVAVLQAFNGENFITSIEETYYIPASLTSVNVTGGKILRGAFYGCTGIVRVTLGEGVTSIGNFAFYNCTGLTDVVMTESVLTIGTHAFRNCTSLESVTIPGSVRNIGNYAFSGCTGLEKILYCGTESEWNSLRKGTGWDEDTGDYQVICTD
ncbi:MAG: leucine-rich repeat domain-containing protein [Clostridia bacterium]|nr:leucine-rich repeat domain-containing protein [Clostridia bacterium]